MEPRSPRLGARNLVVGTSSPPRMPPYGAPLGRQTQQQQPRPGSIFWKPPPEAAALCESQRAPSFVARPLVRVTSGGCATVRGAAAATPSTKFRDATFEIR